MANTRNKAQIPDDYDFQQFDGKREDLLIDRNQTSFPDMPLEIIEHILREGKGDVNDKSFSPVVMAKLAIGNKALNAFFKPRLDAVKAQEAKKLLECVLFPITANVEKIIELAKKQPQLFFIKATAQDQAMDLEGNRRTIEDWSPYQAMFGTSDNDLLAIVKPPLDAYLKTLPKGQEFAEAHVKEKFPNGLDFPASTADFNTLAAAMTQDQQLKDTGNPSPTTEALLKQLQATFKPGVVRMGHHFNMNEYVKAHEIYDQNYYPWNENQIRYFTKHVLGFLQRLKTGVYLQVDITGVENLAPMNQNDNQKLQPLRRDFEVMNYAYAVPQKVVVLPLDGDPACRLGESFLVVDYTGRRGAWGVLWAPGAVPPLSISKGISFTKLMSRKTASLSNLCPEANRSAGCRADI